MDERTANPEELRSLGDDLGQLRDAAFERGGAWRDRALAFIDEHPYAAVGVAFGAGYLISGALFSRATFRALAFGGRFFFGGLVKQAIVGGGLSLLAPLLHGMATEVSTEK